MRNANEIINEKIANFHVIAAKVANTFGIFQYVVVGFST